MGYIIDVGTYFVTHPVILVSLFLLYVLVFSLTIILAPRKSGANPFKSDIRRPPEPLVIDHAIRDKVLKQGFQSRLVPDKLDVIVIGSGIGGLASAALLSKAGKKVLVLEQHDQAGGCCHTFIEDNYEFDIGIHYIGNMGDTSRSKFLLDQISCGQIQWDKMDNEFDMVAIKNDDNMKYFPIYTSGYDSYQSCLLNQFPNEKEAIEKFIELLKKADKNILPMVLFKILPKWLMVLLVKTRIIYLATPYFSLASKSLDDVLNELTNNKDLKTVLSYNYANYGVEPSRSSFMLHACMINHYMEGAFYPRGGASELAFHIIPVIEQAGGKVLVRAKVKEIILEDGIAAGVRLDRAGITVDIRAPLVISDVGFINTFTELIPREVKDKSQIYQQLENKVKVGLSCLSVFVGLKGSSSDLNLKKQNIWVLGSNDISSTLKSYLDKCLDDALDLEIPFLFISSPSARDSSYEVRHPGKSALTILVHGNWSWFKNWENERVKNRGEDYNTLKKVLLQKIWKHVLKIYSHLEDKVEYMEIGTGVTNNFYINSKEGEIYGLDHSKERFSDPDILTHLRPDIGIPGLLLTGQDVMCCGLVGALTGAMITSIVALNRNLYSDLEKLSKETKKKQVESMKDK